MSSLIEFQYADDNSAALSENHLQQILTAFNSAYTKLGVSINSKKTQTIYQPSPTEATAFGTAFGHLRKRVFQDHDIRTDIKMLVYKAVVIPALLYASETWTTYRRHLKALEKFHQRCLRSILNISWEDRRTNISMLKEAKMTSIEAFVIKNQLRWSSQVVRMTDKRLPKQIFYSSSMKVNVEEVKIRGSKTFLKPIIMKKCSIDFNNWESDAKDRKLWRTTVREGTATFETNRCAELEEKRRRRKERELQPRPNLPSGITCPECRRTFKARIGLISHLRVHKQTN